MSAEGNASAKLSSGDLGGSGFDGTLGMSTVVIRQCWDLLQSEQLLGNGGLTADNEQQYGWEYEVPIRIHDFRDVETLADYLAVRLREEAPAPIPAVAPPLVTPPLPDRKRRVFIVHGHDHQLLRDIELWLRQAVPAAEPVVLVDQPNLGQTVIEKLEANV